MKPGVGARVYDGFEVVLGLGFVQVEAARASKHGVAVALQSSGYRMRCIVENDRAEPSDLAVDWVGDRVDHQGVGRLQPELGEQPFECNTCCSNFCCNYNDIGSSRYNW